MNKIFVINGNGGVGKDLFIEFVKDICYNKVYSISSIAPIKELAKTGKWDGKTKDKKSRKLLSELKKLFTEFNDLPLDYMLSSLEKIEDNNNIIFFHIREPSEIEKLKSKVDGLFTVLIDKEDKENWDNSSDNEVYNYAYDIIIYNDSSKEKLYSSAKMFCIIYDLY